MKTETRFACECVTPCVDSCADAMNRATIAAIETRKYKLELELDILGTGWIAVHDPEVSAETRANRGCGFNVYGRIVYDFMRVRKIGGWLFFDGHAKHGKDSRRERLILASGTRDDAHGAYADTGVTIASDIAQTEGVTRADAARDLLAVVSRLADGSHKMNKAIATIRAVVARYSVETGESLSGSDRVTLYRARTVVRDSLASLTSSERETVADCLSVLNMTNATTRPDHAHTGSGDGLTMRENRTLASVSRTRSAVAVSAGGK